MRIHSGKKVEVTAVHAGIGGFSEVFPVLEFGAMKEIFEGCIVARVQFVMQSLVQVGAIAASTDSPLEKSTQDIPGVRRRSKQEVGGIIGSRRSNTI